MFKEQVPRKVGRCSHSCNCYLVLLLYSIPNRSSREVSKGVARLIYESPNRNIEYHSFYSPYRVSASAAPFQLIFCFHFCCATTNNYAERNELQIEAPQTESKRIKYMRPDRDHSYLDRGYFDVDLHGRLGGSG